MISIQHCLEQIHELADRAVKMREVVNNDKLPSDLRYQAIVTEEGLLQLITRYIDYIEKVKFKDADLYSDSSKN